MHPIMASLRHWLYAHDVLLDLLTVWALTVGLAILAVVKAWSWWTLRRTQDQTGVGRALKRQKATEVVIFLVLALLYGLTLDAYYEHARFGFWVRLGIRGVLIAAILVAVIFGLRFVHALTAAVDDPFPDPANDPPTGLP